MPKRGLSDIVTTVLLILAALAAVALIWIFLQPMLRGSSIGTEQYTTHLTVPSNSISVDQNESLLSLNVKRDPGAGDVVGMLFGLQAPDGTTRAFRQNVSLNELEMKNFVINYSGYDLTDVVTIKVTPIFRDNQTGQEQLGLPILQIVTNKTLGPYYLYYTNGLVAHWGFNGNWVEYTNNGMDGAASNTNVDFDNNKKFGIQSAKFQTGSSNDFINIGDTPRLDGRSFTIIAWVYLGGNGGGQYSIFNKSTPTTGFGAYYDNLGSNHYWKFSLMAPTYSSVSLDEPIGNVKNQWKFFAISYNDSIKNMTICSDSNCNSAIASTSYITNNQNFMIGSGWLGNIDDALFFNRALSSDEIAAIRTRYTGT
jgi:hypothetical protein